jgi:hypothetical protein
MGKNIEYMYRTKHNGHNDSNNIDGDVVANHGEDLRFPISSSSGFSSPFLPSSFEEVSKG